MATQRTTTSTVSKTSAASIANIRKLFKEAKTLFAPEGEFMGGIEAQLARTEKRAVASGAQGLAAAGLAGTSIMGGLGKKFQEEVAVPALAQAESTRLSSLAGLMQSQASAEVTLAPRYTTQYGSVNQQTSQWGIPKRPTAQSTAQPRTAQPAAPAATKPVAPRGTLNVGPLLEKPVTKWEQLQWDKPVSSTYYGAGYKAPVSKLSSFYTPDFKKSLAATFTAL